MKKIVQAINQYESFILFFWVILVALHTSDIFSINPLSIVVSCSLSLFYLLQGRFGQMQLASEKVYVRMFPSLFGNFSSIAVIGVFFKSMQYPGSSMMLNVGAIGMVICGGALFVPAIQSHFLPVLKKFYLRIIVLVALIFGLMIL